MQKSAKISAAAGSGNASAGLQSPRSWVISGGFFALMGLAMFLGGVALALHQRAFLADAHHVMGTIVDPDPTIETSSRHLPAAFSFVDGAGKKWRVNAVPSDEARYYTVGQKVEVYYPPAHPDQAILGGFDDLWSLSVFVCVISFVPLAAGLWTVRVGLLRMRQF